MRHLLLAGALLFLLAFAAAPVMAQGSGAPDISLVHYFAIDRYGFGMLNETLTFQNSGSSAVQIPAVQVGIPAAIASKAAGFVLSNGSFTMTEATSGGSTSITVTPVEAALAPHASSSVSVRSLLSGVLNITAGSSSAIGATVLLSPSLSSEVSSLTQLIKVPTSGTLKPVPQGFSLQTNGSVPTYSRTTANVTPAASVQSFIFTDTDQASFTPIKVISFVRAIIPSANGSPTVSDAITFQNLANYSLSSLHLTMIQANITQVTIVPSGEPPLLNPKLMSLSNGYLFLSETPFGASLGASDNLTLTMVYPVPTSLVHTSGTQVTVSIPYALPVEAVPLNYTVRLTLPRGMSAVAQTEIHVANGNSLASRDALFTYSVNPGWAADQAIPAAALLFAIAFVILAVRRRETEEPEEEEQVTSRLGDAIKAFEEKIALLNSSIEELASKQVGTVDKAEFDRTRGNLDLVKGRAVQRLNEVRQTAETKRYADLLQQISDAEREEDRAAKDLINLYEQYYSRRMREETFQKLLPNYRRRLDSTTNHLSDLLNAAQKEGK